MAEMTPKERAEAAEARMKELEDLIKQQSKLLNDPGQFELPPEQVAEKYIEYEKREMGNTDETANRWSAVRLAQVIQRARNDGRSEFRSKLEAAEAEVAKLREHLEWALNFVPEWEGTYDEMKAARQALQETSDG